MRSGKKRSIWLFPQLWKEEMCKRFEMGWEKYGLGNCYRAIGTLDLDFVREFYQHADDHLAGFLRTVMHGPDEDGEGPLDHLGAAAWNCGMLMTYWVCDPQLVRRAFNAESLLRKSEEPGIYGPDGTVKPTKGD